MKPTIVGTRPGLGTSMGDRGGRWISVLLLWIMSLAALRAAELSSVPSAITRYLQDADGQRVGKLSLYWDSAEGGWRTNVTRLLIDTLHPSGFAQRLSEQDGQAARDRGYLHGLSPIAEMTDNRVSYAVTDAQGSVRGRAEEAGELSELRTYDAFGNRLPGGMDVSNGPEESASYAGEFADSATGLQDLRSRQYEPAAGRFRTMDSYEGRRQMPAGLHKYGYAEQDPVNHSDPTGHESLGQQTTTQAGIGTMARVVFPAVGRASVMARHAIGRSMVQASRLRVLDPGEYLMGRAIGAAASLLTGETFLGIGLLLDETQENEKGGVLYRAMSGVVMPDLLPDNEYRAGTFLGIRPSDIYVQNGLALPVDRQLIPQGLSVTPDTPSKLPSFALRKVAKHEARVWGIYRRLLDPRLEYRPDPARPTEHGLIGPKFTMPLTEFRNAIRETRTQWAPLTP